MGDARRGRELFQSRNCVACHSVNGVGGSSAPDLALSVSRGFSPYQLAALLWNHAPRMWIALRTKGIALPELSEQDGADLFVYFYSARLFTASGDVGRGRALFRSRQCASCHGIERSLRDGIQPVSAWTSLDDPIVLAQRMWNHSSGMRREIEQKRLSYPTLSSQELTDILTYLRGQTGQKGSRGDFSPGSPESGRRLFAAKGCAGCHKGQRSIEDQPTRYTLTDLTVALWKHPFVTRTEPPALSYDEMRDLLGYVMAAQFLQEKGDFDRGRRVFQKKQCGRCHDDPASGAPPRSGMTGRMSSFGIMAAVTRHGPAMLERMRKARFSWPSITALEMADLTTYLHGLEFRQRPVPPILDRGGHGAK